MYTYHHPLKRMQRIQGGNGNTVELINFVKSKRITSIKRKHFVLIYVYTLFFSWYIMRTSICDFPTMPVILSIRYSLEPLKIREMMIKRRFARVIVIWIPHINFAWGTIGGVYRQRGDRNFSEFSFIWNFVNRHIRLSSLSMNRQTVTNTTLQFCKETLQGNCIFVKWNMQ